MTENKGQPKVGHLYDAAYEMHYTAKNLRKAIELYQGVIAAHPDSGQAGFSRSQILNITHAVVPEQVLVDSQAVLALSYLDGTAEKSEVA